MRGLCFGIVAARFDWPVADLVLNTVDALHPMKSHSGYAASEIFMPLQYRLQGLQKWVR